jgi:anti-sigma factor RsiW
MSDAPGTPDASGSAGAPDAIEPDPGIAEADRLITVALTDHMQLPAPRRLREQLARDHAAPRKPWRPLAGAFAGFVLGAGMATAIVMLVLRGPAPATVIVDEAVGDHLRIVAAQHPLAVESNDMHNVKPWFTGRLDFVPPVSFLGDDEFHLRGGEVAIFRGHRAAAFVYQRRLHTISLFVFADTEARPREETTARGFHVIAWASEGFGMALVSDINWDDLRLLEARLRN